jgi:CubicO group peptidase (beta-lactamase class C family)
MLAALLDEVDGVRLVPPDRLRQLSAMTVDDVDQIFGNRAVWSLGFAIGRPRADAKEAPTAFGMDGVGGSYAYADTAAGIAVALTKNRLTADFSAAERIAGIATKALACRPVGFEVLCAATAGGSRGAAGPVCRRRDPDSGARGGAPGVGSASPCCVFKPGGSCSLVDTR